VPIALVLLLITDSLEQSVNIGTVKVYSIAQNSNSCQLINNTNNANITNNTNDANGNHTLDVGPPQKVILSKLSHIPMLSPEKKQVLEQCQGQTHHSPSLPSSGQAIHGPIPGTQTP
jgi:hypothetical protein